jgi:hypothetical protein
MSAMAPFAQRYRRVTARRGHRDAAGEPDPPPASTGESAVLRISPIVVAAILAVIVIVVL